jgi:hypothetical protein
MLHVPQRAARTTRGRPAKNTDTAQPAKATAKAAVTKASKVLLNSHLPAPRTGCTRSYATYRRMHAADTPPLLHGAERRQGRSSAGRPHRQGRQSQQARRRQGPQDPATQGTAAAATNSSAAAAK